MLSRGKLCVKLAKKISSKDKDQNDDERRPDEKNVFIDQYYNPGYIEVPLESLSKNINLHSNSSSSICQDTSGTSNEYDDPSFLQTSPLANIVTEDSILNSPEIFPISPIIYKKKSIPLESSDTSKEDIVHNEHDYNTKSYEYLQNMQFDTSASVSHVIPKSIDYQQRNASESICIIENPIGVQNIQSLQESVISEKQNLPNTDRVLHNFGLIVVNETSNLEKIDNNRRWTKKNCCPYCYIEVTHFPRHLQRNHQNEGAVKEILKLTKNDPKRKILLDSLRRQGNYSLNSQIKKTRPVRRPRTAEPSDNFVPCNYCLGFFKNHYLRRHRKKCKLNKNPTNSRENHLSESQAFYICEGQNKEFYESLRLKTEVLNKMRVDEISKTVIEDILICSYGESQLRRHKRVQLGAMISNKLRELGRLLIVLKQTTGIQKLIDVLKPEFFDNIVSATKIISGYNEETRNFKSPSLALHMSTRLVQVCDVANKLIIKKSRFIQCDNSDEALKNIKRLKSLISDHFNSEISSLALKDLNEKHWEKPGLFPLTSELQKFQNYVMDEANNACKHIKVNEQLHVYFRKLTECVMALTLLINRKRMGEVQFLKLSSYTKNTESNHAEEFAASLTESENMLAKNFKRIVTGGKGSKPVAILFPKKIQLLIDVLLSARGKCVPASNEYLFANPKTTNRWLNGYDILKKLAELSGVKNKDLFTSTRLRKQIATVLQVLSVSETEMEQFANFMGHTKKTHEEYYRLPQDIFQTAKVAKLLIAINKGKGSQYVGKSLDNITVTDDSDLDSEDSEPESKILVKSVKVKNQVKLKGPRKLIKKQTFIETDQKEECSSNKDFPPQTIVEKRISSQRQSWSVEQSQAVRKYFVNHINDKVAPKKHEVQEFQKKYPSLFKNRSWVNIKAYIYNCYRTK